MAFPQDPLDLIGELYIPTFGWVDVTSDMRLSSADSGGGVSIEWGRSDWGQNTEPTKVNVTLNNRLGKYSKKNMLSPYFGLLRQNTPFRIAVREVLDPFTRVVSNGWGSTPNGIPWVHAGASSNYAVNGSVASQTHPTSNQILACDLNVTVLDCEQVYVVSVPALVVGGACVTGAVYRLQPDGSCYWLRAELDRDSTDVILKISYLDALGGITDLAVMDPVPQLAYGANTKIKVRSAVAENRLMVKAWLASGIEPRTWQLEVNDDTISVPGAVSLQTWFVGGNTNNPRRVDFDDYELLDRRCTVEVSNWPPRWDLSGNDRWVPIRASGVLRRFQKGQPPVLSALYRSYRIADPLEYWPMEEGQEAEFAASAVGGSPLVPRGILRYEGFIADGSDTVSFGASGDGTGAASLVSLTGGGYLTAPIRPPEAGITSWRFDVSMKFEAGTYDVVNDGPVVPMSWYGGTSTNGTGKPYEFLFEFHADTVLFGGGDSGPQTTLFVLQTPMAPYDSRIHHYSAELWGAGADSWVYFYVDGVLVDSVIWTGIAFPALSKVTPGQSGQDGQKMPSLGHIAVFSPVWEFGSQATQAAAAQGNVGEKTADRIDRLLLEENIDFTLWGDRDSTAELGLQKPGTTADLIRDAVQADMGILFEPRYTLAIGYRPHASLFNQTASQFSYTGKQVAAPFEPVDDDQVVRNYITVTREGGASYTVEQLDGPNSTAQIGRYVDSPTVNVATDQQAESQAWWRMALGSVDELRISRLALNLATTGFTTAANQPARAGAAAMHVGRMAEITNLPVDMPPGGTLQLVQGGTETLDAFERQIVLNTTPGRLYRAGAADGFRAGMEQSTLAAPLAAGATTMSLATTADEGIWVTGNSVSNPTDFPMELLVGGINGERVQVTAITGTTSPQSATIVRGLDGRTRAWPTGAPVVAPPGTVGL